MIAPPSSSTPPVKRSSWMRRQIADPLLNLLKQGLSPAQLSLTVAIGVGCGLVPLLGVTTVMGSFLALRLRLNVAAMLLVAHLMSPLQLLLLIPLLQWGAKLLGNSQAAELTLDKVRYLLSHDLGAAWSLLWRAELGALLLWAAAMVPLVTGLYFGLRPVFRHVAARQKAAQ
ncbi:DUF2062 domain-containing protein [Hymenobacter jejuensis]|uniref:DUF2062 domain-containing protein n=1 Tax=Hymenobacter jejuensis TaxID=2502781 RepID=A0A5B8A2R2_9BACT|nr:DUF2062 domain-containing protein [Hymenobacter jejuensis]QDA61694.1 DUF2062 domain-containing protein [Hymenobacter jejuensis]